MRGSGTGSDRTLPDGRRPVARPADAAYDHRTTHIRGHAVMNRKLQIVIVIGIAVTVLNVIYHLIRR
ncbi:hypothetical protein [Burkholderia sp. GS2Y]|uniref:Uncharacterized protein n=1 Tax=Burkholderia theae TaxID=3143496 RepID=A0ABU9WA14_9BURK